MGNGIDYDDGYVSPLEAHIILDDGSDFDGGYGGNYNGGSGCLDRLAGGCLYGLGGCSIALFVGSLAVLLLIGGFFASIIFGVLFG